MVPAIVVIAVVIFAFSPALEAQWNSFLTLAILAAASAALSAVVSLPIIRLNKPIAKILAVVLGVILFLFFIAASLVILVIESGCRGHPF